MKRVTRVGLALLALTVILSAQTKHPLKLDDIARFREVRDPNLSPDGKQVAYFSIGEAEDYRFYWHDDWVEPIPSGQASTPRTESAGTPQ
jgi:hypothetical protein